MDLNLKLENSWEYLPDESWAWSAYLTGADLPKVTHVQYLLHPSFSRPVRKVDDSARGFRLEDECYEPFEIKALVFTKDGRSHFLTHQMKLATDPVRGRTDAA